jgi:hypothetical protein
MPKSRVPKEEAKRDSSQLRVVPVQRRVRLYKERLKKWVEKIPGPKNDTIQYAGAHHFIFGADVENTMISLKDYMQFLSTLDQRLAPAMLVDIQRQFGGRFKSLLSLLSSLFNDMSSSTLTKYYKEFPQECPICCESKTLPVYLWCCEKSLCAACGLKIDKCPYCRTSLKK